MELRIVVCSSPTPPGLMSRRWHLTICSEMPWRMRQMLAGTRRWSSIAMASSSGGSETTPGERVRIPVSSKSWSLDRRQYVQMDLFPIYIGE